MQIFSFVTIVGSLRGLLQGFGTRPSAWHARISCVSFLHLSGCCSPHTITCSPYFSNALSTFEFVRDDSTRQKLILRSDNPIPNPIHKTARAVDRSMDIALCEQHTHHNFHLAKDFTARNTFVFLWQSGNVLSTLTGNSNCTGMYSTGNVSSTGNANLTGKVNSNGYVKSTWNINSTGNVNSTKNINILEI